MLQQLIREVAASALVQAAIDSKAARTYWDAKYIYLYGIPEYPVEVEIPRLLAGADPTPEPMINWMLGNRGILMDLADLHYQDPSPQPSLEAVYDRKIRLEAAEAYRKHLEGAIKRLDGEIKALRKR